MEAWGWKKISESTQIANGPVFIKTIIVWTEAMNGAAIFNCATSGQIAANRFLTVYCGAHETKVIMFDEPCLLEAGCWVQLDADELFIQFKPV